MATECCVWMSKVSPAVEALSAEESKALVMGSTFARRMETADPEHRRRMCEHGRLLFQPCGFCESGLPAVPDSTHAEQRESAKKWLDSAVR